MKPLANMPEIPKRLRTNERDRRGYPIPWIVMRDRTGRPHFTINDARRVHDCATKRLCGLCGKRLDAGAWFVGGMRCFTEELGAFVDPPMHEECSTFALRVCPFLAAPSYGRRIDDRTLDPSATPAATVVVRNDAMPAERPDVFGQGHVASFIVVPAGLDFVFRPGGAWLEVRRWQRGGVASRGRCVVSPVVWRPARGVTHPALAVPCGTCGAEIGRHCTAHYAQGQPREPHPMRRTIAEAHGFAWAPGATPPPGEVVPQVGLPGIDPAADQGALFP